jgi:hypothetical protein
MRRLADSRLLAVVTLLEVAVAGGLRLLPLPVLRRALLSFRPAAAWLAGTDERRLLWALDGTARRLPFAGNCLVRALVADVILGASDPPLRVTIGVRRTNGRLEAHAWVEREGRVVIGEAAPAGAAPDATFVPLLTWDSSRA